MWPKKLLNDLHSLHSPICRQKEPLVKCQTTFDQLLTSAN